MKKLILNIFFLSLLFNSYGQERNITLHFDRIRFSDLVDTLEKTLPYKFYYSDKWTDSLYLSVNTLNTPADTFIRNTLNREGFTYIITPDNKIILSKGYSIKTGFQNEYLEYLERNSVKIDTSRYLSSASRQETNKISDEYRIFRIGKPSAGEKKQTAVLSGTISNPMEGESVNGAIVFVEKLKAGVMTNADGYYSLTLPKGQYQIEYRMLGLKTTRRNIVIYSDGILNVEMADEDNLMEAVFITADRDNPVRDVRSGIEKINVKMLKQIPMGLGEVDIIKSSLLLPGVQTVGEAAGGYNVRGGSTDQNLVFLNYAPIINTFHFFGFFSAFNSDMVSDVILYKSGMPAKYGGRLSSVMVISPAEGSREKIKVSGGISPVTGRLLVEGPLFENKGSFIIGTRATYSDWILGLFPDYRLQNSTAGFYDVQGSIALDPNDKNSVSLSGYLSNDEFYYFSENAFNYGNLSATLKWDHTFNPRLSASFYAILSNYKYKLDTYQDSTVYNSLNYKLDQKIVRTDFLYKAGDNHNIEFGIDATYYSLLPGVRKPFGDFSNVTAKELEREQALEPSLYLSDEYEVTPVLSLSGGIRGTLFTSFGPQTEYLYNEGTSKSEESIEDTVRYNSGEVVNFYPGLEFRFSSRLILTPETSLKIGIQRVYQYIHMISNTTSMSPTDIWTISDSYIKPERSDQVSLGFYYTFGRKGFESSLETYYKRLTNILDYKGGASLLMNEHLETDVINGSGKAYGIELMVKKQSGSLTGWISYTYSRALLKSNGEFETEKVNNGEYFPADYDKPHDLKLVANAKLSRRFNVTSSFVYNTGRPITFPVAFYEFNNTSHVYYSSRNSYRMPDYARLDFAATVNGNLRARKLNHSSFTLTVYNVLGRENPYSIYFRNEDGVVNGYKMTIFARPIVMLTYNFRILGNAKGDF
jgi:hypothetical protein